MTPGDESTIVVVSHAARYAGAASSAALWVNALQGRRAFRRIPPGRLDLAAYAGAAGEPMSITPIKAGLISDWRFDRRRFLVSAHAFESADLAHWLALEVASDALARLPYPAAMPPERVAVIVGNTLTGEFSRSAAVGLRAPFLDEVLANAAAASGLPPEAAAGLRQAFARELSARLPEPTDETLAGGLANTIAGRIANAFNFKGGAFTVDGACGSSLIAVAQAAEAIAAGRVDCVLAGAVDLSLDPFELIGFSRVGALAADEMRVFDARSSGFWPGEGAGFVLLMRRDMARRQGLEPLAVLRGWGLSSDGAGGLIRPTVEGQVLAIERACRSGGVDPADLAYVEAHGTGTPTGDPVEVRALAAVRSGSSAPLPIGSIKANIGHTKAAAGLAGLIKVIETLRGGTVAPHVGCETPHPVFAETEGQVYTPRQAEHLPDGGRLAGVSSFGFGGINAHVVLEAPARTEGVVRAVLPRPEPIQDCELFCFAADDRAALCESLQRMKRRAETLAWSELADAAAVLAGEGTSGSFRAAVVARDVDELVGVLALAIEAAEAGQRRIDPRAGVFVAESAQAPRIGFLFPGQAAPVRADGGAWRERFETARGLAARLDSAGDPSDTAQAQPAIAAASLAALQVLGRCGVKAEAALGHSLGELAALTWAGALLDDQLLTLAVARGRAFADHAEPDGVMIRLDAGVDQAGRLADAVGLVVACRNGGRETVVAGPQGRAPELLAAAEAEGLDAQMLPVRQAFHSPMMQPAVEPWMRTLQANPLGALQGRVISSVTGGALTPADDLSAVLTRQVTEPVLFADALTVIGGEVDLLVEVGPGQALSRLAGVAGLTALSVDAFGPSLRPLLNVLGAAFACGAALDAAALCRDRRLHPIDLDTPPELLRNPCGRIGSDADRLPLAPPAPTAMPPEPAGDPGESLLGRVRQLVAQELDLDLEAVGPDDRFDTRLHLESLAVARIVARAARAAGAPQPRAPTEFAAATARQLADALAEMRDLPRSGTWAQARIDGVRPWVRTYAMTWRPAPPLAVGPGGDWRSMTLGDELPVGPGRGLIVYVPVFETVETAAQLLALLQKAAAGPAPRRLAILCHDAPLSAFCRSIALEGRFESVQLISGPVGPADALAPEVDDAHAGYREIRIDADGQRLAPVFTPSHPRRAASAPVSKDDVALVVGGGRGIAAECALRLASSTGCGLVLCGRSDPASETVAAILARASAAGVRAAYIQADVLDRQALTEGLTSASVLVGRPTILIHAAGDNRPASLPSLTATAMRETLEPKVLGLENLLETAGPGLRRVYTFGSIIGRIGLEGEAHYALANAWQTARLARYGRDNPGPLSLAIEWSVWGGAGMAERLGVLERLAAKDVDALSVEEALAAFMDLVDTAAAGEVAVTGRFGAPPGLDLAAPMLESLRFLDAPKVHYPGVELVVETRLWPGRDPYLAGHCLAGEMVFPGVMALEAMAQAARQLCADSGLALEISDVTFDRAVFVPRAGAQVIRLCALRRADGAVEVCLRAEDDAFASDRARAVFHPESPSPASATRAAASDAEGFEAGGLYGPLFFQSGPFRRLFRYRQASSRIVTAQIAPADQQRWFGPADRPDLVLADPGARDAALHALQATILHRRLAPVAVRRICRRRGGPPTMVSAVETAAVTGLYSFDIVLSDAAGTEVETWIGATFRAIEALDPGPALAEAPQLLPAGLERLAREALDDPGLRCVLGAAAPDAWPDRRAGLLRALGVGEIARRSDGRPLSTEGGLSLSRAGPGLAVASGRLTGCDLQPVAAFAAERPPSMLRVIDGEPPDEAGAWVAGEALRKLGLRPPYAVRRLAGERLPASAALYDGAGARVLVLYAPWQGGELALAVATLIDSETQTVEVVDAECL